MAGSHGAEEGPEGGQGGGNDANGDFDVGPGAGGCECVYANYESDRL